MLTVYQLKVKIFHSSPEMHKSLDFPVERVSQSFEGLVTDAHDEDDGHGTDEAADAVDPPEVEEDDFVEPPVEVHHHHGVTAAQAEESEGLLVIRDKQQR